jgi:hypothetical protein
LLLQDVTRAIPFVDDLLAVTETWTEHLESLRQIFTALRRAGLKLRREKCTFARDKVTYLGTIISRQGVAPDPAKVTAVKAFPTPKTAKDLKSF